jgi:hypothetical protein
MEIEAFHHIRMPQKAKAKAKTAGAKKGKRNLKVRGLDNPRSTGSYGM